MTSLLARIGVPVLIPIGVWAGTAVFMGGQAAALLIVLSLLELVFSFDNAVVNAPLVGRLSPFWATLFMTAGMLVAVGVVRFALPVLIVALTASLPVGVVADLALHQPAVYGQHLAAAGPLIDAFGGTFLLMIAVGFFLDEAKDHHWLHAIEARLAPLGRYDNTGILAMIAAALVMFFTVPGSVAARAAVFAAAVCGIGLHLALGLFSAITGSEDEDDDEPEQAHARSAVRAARLLTGGAAAVMVARLEVIDASFSFDGVIGAFAVSSNVVLIAAGLGIGALWVRSLTVYMVRAGTLAKFTYLEHGAHWAIAVLGGVMIAKVYGAHLPELAIGCIGLVFIAAAVASSVAERRRAATS